MRRCTLRPWGAVVNQRVVDSNPVWRARDFRLRNPLRSARLDKNSIYCGKRGYVGGNLSPRAQHRRLNLRRSRSPQPFRIKVSLSLRQRVHFRFTLSQRSREAWRHRRDQATTRSPVGSISRRTPRYPPPPQTRRTTSSSIPPPDSGLPPKAARATANPTYVSH